jgi:hypothetical protein
MKKKKLVLIIAIVVVAACLIIAGYFIYSFSRVCLNQECFNKALISCKKVSYTKENIDTVIQYRILGRSGEWCEVNVKLLQVKHGTLELIPLEGKEMVCSVPYGSLTTPEENLGKCHGLLREEIQEIIIKRMHGQIVENLGKISEEVTKIL